jgi:hypothetical protein
VEGVLLDPTTGQEQGRASVPASGEVEAWRRKLAERDVREQLRSARRSPGLQATTTTNRYLSFPAAAAGISKASSGGAAWSFSTYIEVVPVNTITATYYVAALVFQPPAATASTLTNEFLIEIATGLAGSEVLIVKIPFTVRNVTGAGYIPPAWIQLPEPKQVAANTRLSMRFAYSVATTAVTINGFKIVYETA